MSSPCESHDCQHGAYEGCETPPDGRADRGPRARAAQGSRARQRGRAVDGMRSASPSRSSRTGGGSRSARRSSGGSAAYVVSVTTADGRARRAQARDAGRARRQRRVRSGAPGGAAGTRTRVRRTSSSSTKIVGRCCSSAWLDRSTTSGCRSRRRSTRSRRPSRWAGNDREHPSLWRTGAEQAESLEHSIGATWDRLDRPCPEARGAARAGVRPPEARRFDEATAVAIHGDAHPWNVLESPTGGFKLIDPDGHVVGARARSRDPARATGTTSCSRAIRQRRCDPGARAFKKSRVSTRKPSGSGPTRSACPPGCSSCASATRTACRSWRSPFASQRESLCAVDASASSPFVVTHDAASTLVTLAGDFDIVTAREVAGQVDSLLSRRAVHARARPVPGRLHRLEWHRPAAPPPHSGRARGWRNSPRGQPVSMQRDEPSSSAASPSCSGSTRSRTQRPRDAPTLAGHDTRRGTASRRRESRCRSSRRPSSPSTPRRRTARPPRPRGR